MRGDRGLKRWLLGWDLGGRTWSPRAWAGRSFQVEEASAKALRYKSRGWCRAWRGEMQEVGQGWGVQRLGPEGAPGHGWELAVFAKGSGSH